MIERKKGRKKKYQKRNERKKLKCKEKLKYKNYDRKISKVNIN